MAEFATNPERLTQRTVSAHEGENSRDVGYLLSENAVRHTQNFIINEPGKRRMRGGVQSFGGLTDLPGGLFPYFLESLEQRLAAVWGSLLYTSTGNAVWAQIATGESMVSGKLHMGVMGRATAGRALFICQAERSDSGASDQSFLFAYNIDNDSSTKASQMRPRCIEFFQNRLWAGGNRAGGFASQDLWWSEVGSGFGYSSGNTLLIEPGVGGEVTALVQTRDETPRLIIFKDRAIATLLPKWGSSSALIPTPADALDTVNSSVQLLTQGAGCIATRTAIWVPGNEGADVFFLAADGVRALSRAENDVVAGAGLPISWNAKDLFDRVNWTHAHKAVAAVYDNAYHIALPLDGATYNTHVARFDLFSRGWSVHNWSARDLTIFSLAKGQERMFMQYAVTTADCSATGLASPVAYQVYRTYETGRPDPGPTNIIAVEESRLHIFGEPLKKKRWDAFNMIVSSTETQWLELQYKVDNGSWAILASEPIPGLAGTIILGATPLPWNDPGRLLRKKCFSLWDLEPGYSLEIRLSTITGETSAGAPTIFTSEVSAFMLEDRHESET